MRLLRLASRLTDYGVYVSMAAVFAIMALVTVDVILRNLLSSSIPGSDEIAEFLQGVAVFFGIAATLRGGGHIAADLLVEKLSARSQAKIDLFTNIISLIVFGLMTYALWSIATGPGASYEVSSTLQIPTQPFWMVAVLGVGFLCVEIARLIVNCVRALSGDRP